MTLLADIVFARTYAKTKEDGKKETYEECIKRTEDMHLERFPGAIKEEVIRDAFKSVYAKRVMPSMRGVQFAGAPIVRDNARIFNCSVISADCIDAFGEFIFLLMNGVGVGYSVQDCHISKLPIISEGEDSSFVIPDSREGWADSAKLLIANKKTKFDYSMLRKEGSPLSTGGTASGPDPLQHSHNNIRAILNKATGRQLTALECSDILCLCADFVVVGGTRRAATIALFSPNNKEMLASKQGDWWLTAPHRARANISAIIDPKATGYNVFSEAYDACMVSNMGEPGFVFINESDKYGTNPCGEISLKYNSFCNLTSINCAACHTKEEFRNAAIDATVIGTLQAAYTDFTYLRPIWKKNTDEQALLGVSLNGLADNWPNIKEWLSDGKIAGDVKLANMMIASLIGIKEAERIGCVKPEGSTSAVLDCSSGIHAVHDDIYVRRVRLDNGLPLTKYLLATLPSDVIEQDVMAPTQSVITYPFKAENGAIVRGRETAIELLERALFIRKNWIEATHNKGPNCHNVSLTATYRDNEIMTVKRWLWSHREDVSGVSLFPYSDVNHPQLPREKVTLEEYNRLVAIYDSVDVDLSNVDWTGQVDDRKQVVACANGACEI